MDLSIYCLIQIAVSVDSTEFSLILVTKMKTLKQSQDRIRTKTED